MVLSNRRYSQHARRSLVHARLLAQKFQHSIIDTDHLLIGIWRTRGSIGSRALQDMDIDWDEARKQLGHLHTTHQNAVNPPPYSDSLKDALEVAADESRWLGQHYIGTEHFLLGLVRAGTGHAPDLLRHLKITNIQIRRRVRRLLNEGVTEMNLDAVKRLGRLSELSRRVLNAAARQAEEYQHPTAGLEHLLLVLAQEKRSMAARWLQECGLQTARLEQDLKRLQLDEALAAAGIDDILERAVDRAEALGTHYTGTDHILLAMTLDHEGAELIRQYGGDITRLQTRIYTSLNR